MWNNNVLMYYFPKWKSIEYIINLLCLCNNIKNKNVWSPTLHHIYLLSLQLNPLLRMGMMQFCFINLCYKKLKISRWLYILECLIDFIFIIYTLIFKIGIAYNTAWPIYSSPKFKKQISSICVCTVWEKCLFRVSL